MTATSTRTVATKKRKVGRILSENRPDSRSILFNFHISVTKQKWVPLDIDLAKNRGKRERSPKYHAQRERNGEGEG